MTSRSDVERALDRYLAEGGERVPDRVIDAALAQIDNIPQRRALRVPWRFDQMPTFLKPALAGAAVIAVLVVGTMFLNRGSSPGVGGPGTETPAPSSMQTPAATATVNCSVKWLADECRSTWLPFTSGRYGYEIAYPPTWQARPATGEWSFETSRLDFATPEADHFTGSSGQGILVTAFAADVPPGMSEDEWLTAYYEGSEADGQQCDALVEEMKPLPPITVDGRPGVIAVNDACSDAQAFVFIDGRVHVFAVWRPGQASLLEAFLSTVRFR